MKPREDGAAGLGQLLLGFPPSSSECKFNGDKVLYLARTGLKTPDSGPIEVFWVAGSKKLNDPSGLQLAVCRSVSTNEGRSWSVGEVVIDGRTTQKGAIAWFVNAQNLGRRPDTGEYQVRSSSGGIGGSHRLCSALLRHI